MNMKEFLALEAPDRYDFSNDGAREAYHVLDGFHDTYEKFFTYMHDRAKSPDIYEEGKAGVMTYGAEYKEECESRFGTIHDPDSESGLLQEIYTKLWDELNLEYCRGKKKYIQGETMNSANTTLCKLYEKSIETQEQRNDRSDIKPAKCKSQGISIAYIISRYAEKKSEQKEKYDKIEGLKCFLSVYHTLGNFIPVPAGCNGPRGCSGSVKDYWDLTLKIIYEYYVCEKDKIKDIVGKENELYDVYKKWLDSFQDNDTARGNWQCFVEKNYLQDFVNQNDDGSYGMPKELWKGHFKESVLPNGIEQIEQFYVNASCFITARGIRMLIRLRRIFLTENT